MCTKNYNDIKSLSYSFAISYFTPSDRKGASLQLICLLLIYYFILSTNSTKKLKIMRNKYIVQNTIP
ncbi:hypothetical protein C0J52_26101 [Blattella germanica]|nr:hypothetical protein C0J52_26101 [Blattella germanica]